MAKITVKYTATLLQIFEWPDDEMGYFNHENLVLNLDHDDSNIYGDGDVDIQEVLVNGKDYDF